MLIKDRRNQLIVHPVKKYRNGGTPDKITVHHSGTKSGNAAGFARYHVQQHQWPGIGYHYVILRNGAIEKCWSENLVTYHTGGLNTGNIGICLVGNGSFSVKQMDSLLFLIDKLQKKYKIPHSLIRGHREWPGQRTECPGMEVGTLREKLAAGKRRPLIKSGSRGEDVRKLQRKLQEAGIPLKRYGADGIYGMETMQAVKEYQKQKGLNADGIAGDQTWQLLLKKI